MSKQTETLKLALEALDVLLTEPIAHKAADRAEYLLLQAAPAIREALTEQPAQQQEPVQTTPNFAQLKQILDNLDRCHHMDSKQEFLRTWIRDWTEHKLAKHIQPASKPWVGLTEEEIHKMTVLMGINPEWKAEIEIVRSIVRNLEAKLKEKNHGHC
jgi:hypothetical protein